MRNRNAPAGELSAADSDTSANLSRRGFLQLFARAAGFAGASAVLASCAKIRDDMDPYNDRRQARHANNRHPVDQGPYVRNGIEKTNYDRARNAAQLGIKLSLLAMSDDALNDRPPVVQTKRSGDKGGGQVIYIRGLNEAADRARRKTGVDELQQRVIIREDGSMTMLIGKFVVVNKNDYSSDVLTDGIEYNVQLSLAGPNVNPVEPVLAGAQAPWGNEFVSAVDSPDTFALMSMRRFDNGVEMSSIQSDPNTVILDPAYAANFDYTETIANDGIAYGDEHAWLLVGDNTRVPERLEADDAATYVIFDREMPYYENPVNYALAA